MNKYKFDEKQHLHQILIDGEWKPLTGTSSVMSVLNKPLAYWASGLAVKEFGCPDPKVLTKIKNKKATASEIEALELCATETKLQIADMPVEDYIKLIDKAYRAHATSLTDSKDAGVDLHAEIERYIKDQMAGNKGTYNARIQPFIAWAEKRIKRWLFSELHMYSEKMWTGGISDAGFEDVDGKYGIFDAKSAKDAYMSHWGQIGGYDLQLSENGGFTANGDKIFDLEGKKIDYYVVFPFGAERPEPKLYHDMEGIKDFFKACLTIYKMTPKDN